MAAITGIDASRHQGTVDWVAVRRAGHSFAFIKATEGTSYSYTSWYKTNAPKVRAAGLVLGAYHFLRGDRDPAQQARYYVQTVGGFTGVVAILDVETAANGTKPTGAHVRAWVTEFRRLVPNKTVVIYTGRWYWVGVMGNPPGADLGPLWHSEYESTAADVANGPELDNYGGWGNCLVWQHTSTGRCPGVNGNCDLNIFYGTTGELLKLAGASAPTPSPIPPMEETDMLIVTNPRGQSLLILGGEGTIGFSTRADRDAIAKAVEQVAVSEEQFDRFERLPRLDVT